MQEVIVRFKNRRTLKVLNILSKYLGFKISVAKKQEKSSVYYINGIPVERGDSKIDLEGLNAIFTDQTFDAKHLRESVWQRKG